jgi:hypothetical protein
MSIESPFFHEPLLAFRRRQVQSERELVHRVRAVAVMHQYLSPFSELCVEYNVDKVARISDYMASRYYNRLLASKCHGVSCHCDQIDLTSDKQTHLLSVSSLLLLQPTI